MMLHNMILAVDLLINKKTYLRQLWANGFIVPNDMSRWQMYKFFRRSDDHEL